MSNNSSSSSSSASSAPMSAEDQLRASRQTALLDAMMERKLANLNREYADCLAAGETPNEPDYDCVEVTSEEYNEAWARYQQDCNEELNDESDDFNSDDDGESCAAEIETTETPDEPLHKPLTEDKISSIKSVMSGIRLRPPPWAMGQSEEVWMAQIMRRTGLMNKPTITQPVTQPPAESQSSLSSQSAPAKSKKKKSKKKKSAKKAAVASFEADFDAQFPASVESVDQSSTTTPA